MNCSANKIYLTETTSPFCINKKGLSELCPAYGKSGDLRTSITNLITLKLGNPVASKPNSVCFTHASHRTEDFHPESLPSPARQQTQDAYRFAEALEPR